jgi:ribosomal protein L7/L12
MARYRLLFRCVGEAVVAKGFRGLAGLIPFGDHLFDIAADALNRYRHSCMEDQLQAEVQAAAQATLDEVKAEVAAVVAEVRQSATTPQQNELDRPEIQQVLASYLCQIPGSIRRSLRRPRDPTGTTVPPGFTVREPEQMLKLLPPRPPRFRAGDQPIGNWVLTDLLGMGGFGEVWKAEHPTLKGIPPVALKFCLDPEAARTLRHEAALLSQAMHQSQQPGIVTLRNAWLDHEPLCLEYEFINGGDLCGLLADWQQLEPRRRMEQAGRIIQRLATAVGQFHRLTPPVVHRDLKPANILVQRKGDQKIELRIADFGIGGLAARQEIARTRHGVSRGDLLSSALRGAHTPLYASPQQVRGDPPDPRDDVFSLGVIWYQILTGELTSGRPGGSRWRLKLQEQGMRNEQIDLMEACFEENPQDRPDNGAILAAKLATLLTSPGATSTSSSPGSVPAVGTTSTNPAPPESPSTPVAPADSVRPPGASSLPSEEAKTYQEEARLRELLKKVLQEMDSPRPVQPPEPTAFSVFLDSWNPATKIPLIKAVREFTDLGLKESKDLVERAPCMVVENVGREMAEKIKKKMEEAGARISLRAFPQPESQPSTPSPSRFTVKLNQIGPNKISLIKVVMEITKLGLKETKDLVERAPAVIKSVSGRLEAEEIKKKLEATGAKVSILT